MLHLHVAPPRPAMPCMEAVNLVSGCAAYTTSTWLTQLQSESMHSKILFCAAQEWSRSRSWYFL